MFSLRSIRFRITLWYVVTVALILGASGFFWYLSLAQSLRTEVDDRLFVIAEGVAADLLREDSLLNDGRPCNELARELELAGSAARFNLFDAHGDILCATLPAAAAASLAPQDVAAAARRGQPRLHDLAPPGQAAIRVIDYPLLEGSTTRGLVQVGISLAPAERTLDRLLSILLISFPLPLFALALGGWFLADRALAPVEKVTLAMERVNTDNLSQRLPGEDEKNEIGRLVKSFNGMLIHLENSFRRVRQFAADASHELRTPLTVLRGETEVALRWTKDPQEFRTTLESNLEEIDRMGRIIEDLLLLAKSEAGEVPMTSKKINLGDLLRDLSLQGKILGENKGVAVSLDLPGEQAVHVMGDELRLHQMFLNLISNGIKYTPTGGRVILSLAVEAGEAAVTIADTGVGMAPEHLNRIFDRFYRVDKQRSQESGAGLGLSIVKWIVEAHNGRIAVSSTVDVGSEFKVFLPLAGTPSSPS